MPSSFCRENASPRNRKLTMAATTGSTVARIAACPASSFCRPFMYYTLGSTQLIRLIPKIPPQTCQSANRLRPETVTKPFTKRTDNRADELISGSLNKFRFVVITVITRRSGFSFGKQHKIFDFREYLPK